MRRSCEEGSDDSGGRSRSLSLRNGTKADATLPQAPVRGLTYSHSRDGAHVYRTTHLRNGGLCRSRLRVRDPEVLVGEAAADYDRVWLDSLAAPRYRDGKPTPVRAVDLFCGVGGMSLGTAEAAWAVGRSFKVALAADVDAAAQGVYCRNFRPDRFVSDPIQRHVDGHLGAPEATKNESRFLAGLGKVDILLAGPPCQGHSNLNNHTRRRDPKNWLFTRVARFAELVKPKHILIENVQGVLFDHGRAFHQSVASLRKQSYRVDFGVLRGEEIGVPQTRHRIFVVASKTRTPSVSDWEREHKVARRSFQWACGRLPRAGPAMLDRVTVPKPETRARIDWLHDQGEYDLPNEYRPYCHREKEHSYVSVYGRIHPDRPAPTITSGFTVMGQGRFVHPAERRTLTPREGARLQFLPAWFRLEDLEGFTRQDAITLIGNAVPPKMIFALVVELLR